MKNKLLISYNEKLKDRASWLRTNMTPAEKKLWWQLRGRQLLGYKFVRRKPILNYIVDFYAPELRLVIEIDGVSHNFKYDYDVYRENKLKEMGLTVMRFQEFDLTNNIENAIQVIIGFINSFEKCDTP